MAGQVMPLWTKRSFNFNGLTAGSTEAVVAVKTVDVSAYREATITVRAHTRDIVNASSKIEIIAYMTAPTGEDPAVDFVSGTALTTATITSGSTSVLSTANLSTFGGYLRVVVLGTRVTSGNCSADLSADLVVKE